IEPRRGHLRAERARGGLEQFHDFVHIHRQDLGAGSGTSAELIRTALADSHMQAARTIDSPHCGGRLCPEIPGTLPLAGLRGLALKCGNDKDAIASVCNDLSGLMASLDSVSIAILLGAVLAPSMVLATIGVLLTALLTAPVAKYVLDISWIEALLIGAVVASTDAAAVFLLVHTQGLRLRPRVGATLEAESGTNDPFAIFLTLMLVEFISIGQGSAVHVALEFAQEAVLGTIMGVVGGRLVVLALNKVAL